MTVDCNQCDSGRWFNAKRTASIECRNCSGTGKIAEAAVFILELISGLTKLLKSSK
jgi:hypothetical protein